MDQRISLITLGVGDLAASRAFYRRLGFEEAEASQESVAFFSMGDFAFGLFGREALAHDAGVAATGSGFRGVALAYNVASREAVAEVLKEAEAAGATITKQAEDVFWGGHSGYFADPDGHLWEVAFNPYVTLGPKGEFRIS